jgi:hypothetical protein
MSLSANRHKTSGQDRVTFFIEQLGPDAGAVEKSRTGRMQKSHLALHRFSVRQSAAIAILLRSVPEGGAIVARHELPGTAPPTYGTVLRRDAFPGTSCQATIGAVPTGRAGRHFVYWILAVGRLRGRSAKIRLRRIMIKAFVSMVAAKRTITSLEV